MRRIRIIGLASLSFITALLSPYVSRAISFLMCLIFSANSLCSFNIATLPIAAEDAASAYTATAIANPTGNSDRLAQVQAGGYCNTGTVISAGVDTGFDGKQYFISYDYTRGTEQIEPKACGREYQVQPVPTQASDNVKFVYLVDGYKNRVSPTVYVELADGSLQVYAPNNTPKSGTTTVTEQDGTRSVSTSPITSLDDGNGINSISKRASSSSSASKTATDPKKTSTRNTSTANTGNSSSSSSSSSSATLNTFSTLATTAIAPQTNSLTTAVKINFQPDSSTVPTGYTKDIGLAFDSTRGFGWVRQDSLSSTTHVPLDISPNTRDRKRTGIDPRLNTIIHMQFPSTVNNSTAVKIPAAWEYTIPNGSYNVTVSVGDQSPYDSFHTINVEGVNAINNFQGSSTQEFKQATVQVTVNDGLLTIDAIGGTNTKLDYVDIVPYVPQINAKINFQPDSSSVPTGYTKDIGLAFDSTRGFGWVRQDSLSSTTHVPLDISPNTRDRKRTGIDPRLNTLIHMQFPTSSTNTTAVKIPAAWEYVIPNGTYNVLVSVGDQSPYDSLHTINVEGVNAINQFQGSSTQEFKQASVQVDVSDGLLTIDAIGGTNTKLDYVEITTPSALGPAVSVENLDTIPFSDRLVTSRIGALGPPPAPNFVHDISTLRIKNTGSAALQINGLPITGTWQLVNSISFPVSIAAGSYLDVPVKFIATGNGLNTGTLTVQSNDPNTPNLNVQLAGFWQSVPEGGDEPTVAQIVSTFGYKTIILRSYEYMNHRGKVQTVGDEILSPYWQVADGSKPVIVKQLAAYHSQNKTATIFWHNKGDTTNLSTIVVQAASDAQTMLPRKNGSSTQLATGTFNPGTTATFGFKVDSEWTDDTLNDATPDYSYGCTDPCGHHVRIWPAKDRQGVTIPYTWILAMDYKGINYDYNDNLYLLSNIIPAPTTTLYRVDAAGNSAYTDVSANSWSVDTGFFSPSTAIAENGGSPPPAIANTVDDVLYQTYRGNVGSSTPQSQRIISYNFPISTSGKVNVRLHFAELYWGAPSRGTPGPGKRVFDVYAEGVKVLSNFDITAATGGALIATVVPLRGIQVSDGMLNLDFQASVDFPSIAAIEVLQ